jgi:hypothetical protein
MEVGWCRAVALGLVVGLWANAAAAEPSAADVKEARVRYDRAIKLYRQRAYESALVEFQKAYELAPSYRIDYNIAQVYQELGDPAGAMRSLHRHLRDGGDQLTGSKRKRAEQELAGLRTKVAELVIQTNLEGAEVTVNEVVLGTTPLSDQVWVNPGRHRVQVTYPGRIPAGKVIAAVGGETVEVEFTLVDPALPAPRPAPVVTRPAVTSSPEPRREPAPTWIGWTATGVLAAGAVVTGVLHLSAKNDYEAERDSLGSDPGAKQDALVAAHGRASNYALATDILAATALVAGGVTLYVTLQEGDAAETSIGVGPGTVAWSGRF